MLTEAQMGYYCYYYYSPNWSLNETALEVIHLALRWVKSTINDIIIIDFAKNDVAAISDYDGDDEDAIFC